ncbi:C10 family peptidase [uncultured Duncaniella sp.]|uniref:C10 family peptidase n=1 Tax=uncultured Duncaniella sp. TaxID=2768039 RepID=UPI0025A9B0E9|nr:C10 family peptidase [uncultured Duncaniella sp.]
MPRLFRFLTLFLISAMCIAVSARTVSPSEARQIANDFFGELAPANAPLKVNGINAATDDSEPFYIFNSQTPGHGFVIISGDDRTPRLLGYSDTGTFDADNIPPQLADLLNQYAEQISSITAGETHPSWNTPARAAGSQNGILLETANWGQGEPYNSLTPEFDGQHAPTGCVATAMAIVMKYHNWPEGYNWSEMPVADVSADNSAEIARLMKDAGEAVFMEYGPWESGANVNWIGHKLQQDFKYSPDCQFITAQNFAADEWTAMLDSNLDNGTPVIYNGSGSGNHAFIIDGRQSGNYHINWGWDGLCNGYFALDALCPDSGSDYSNNQGMVINIAPDRSGKEYSKVFSDYGYFWGMSGLNAFMSVDVEEIHKGEPFEFHHTTLSIPTGFDGFIGIAITTEDGNIKEILKTTRFRPESNPGADGDPHLCGNGLLYYNVIPTVDISDNDRLQIIARDNTDTEWKLVLGTLEGPSSIAAKGISPQFSEISLKIDDRTKFSYLDNNTGQYVEIPSGESTLNRVHGHNFAFRVDKTDENADGNIIISVKGKLIYGDYTQSSPETYYSAVTISGGDYSIETMFMNFIDDTIDIERAGTLDELVPTAKAMALRNLTLTGEMNAYDFWFIRDNCPTLLNLNIKGITIKEVATSEPQMGFEISPVQNANAIPEWALSGRSNIEHIILPENLEGIAGNSLSGLNLKTIDIPAGVNSIGLNALYGNPELKAVIMRNPSPFGINDCVFTGTKCPSLGTLFVKPGSKNQYLNTPVWNEFNQIVETDNPELYLGEIVLDGLRYRINGEQAQVIGYTAMPSDIAIPASIHVDGKDIRVTRIDDYAFAECESLETAILSNNITSLGISTFQNCYNLKSVVLSEKLRALPSMAFINCYNLETIENFEQLELLEDKSLSNCGLTHIHIPATMLPASYGTPFWCMPNLKAFSVAENHPVYETYDGCLYRKEPNSLDCVPGMYPNEYLSFKPGVEIILEGAISDVSNLREMVLPPSLRETKPASISCYSLESLTLNENANISTNTIRMCYSLRHFTIPAQKVSPANIIIDSKLENIYLADTDGKSCIINIGNLYDTYVPVENYASNIYVANPSDKLTNTGDATVFIPGKATIDNPNIREMWSYRINRAEGKLSVFPKIDGIVIDRVTINGIEVDADEKGLYSIIAPTERSTTGIDVTVDYTLNGRQAMTTKYSPEFNAELPDEDLTEIQTSVDNLSSENAIYDVYTIEGIMLRSGVEAARLCELNAGIYILRSGSIARKIAIR